MDEKFQRSRREAFQVLIAAAAGLSFASSPVTAQTLGRSNQLVAYLTRSGNTRVVAEALSRNVGANLFEIRTAEPYPVDYEAHVDLAQRQRDAEATPRLAEGVLDMARYETVFLGFPIWGGALPAPIRTFVATHDLAGKILVPFITHGGYGTGSAPETLAAIAADAQILQPFIQECDAERDTLRQISTWLADIDQEL